MADYRALYRKWRPRDFDDVCGQRGITDVLKYEVENGRVSHAYLFCGSRGTGKTSCAKILAKAVNCLHPRGGNPCNACEACRSIDAGVATDVIEMDAASNNGVGNVRDMKDEIAFTPAQLRYRVYIIDEVHMMSGSAFNALLKTLEEPPEYVVFILATTEFNKLPTTIVSRCQHFEFRRMTSEVLVGRLTQIAEAEGIDLREDGARMIARAAQGGMRDAISLLELCAGSQATVDAALVTASVGAGSRDTAYRMMGALAAADYDTVYGIVHDISMTGSDLSVFWQELIDAYRDVMLVRSMEGARQYLDLTDVEYAAVSALAGQIPSARLVYHVTLLQDALVRMQRSAEGKRSIADITLSRMCDEQLSATPEALAARIQTLEREVSRLRLGVRTAPAPGQEAPPVEVVREEAPPAPTPAAAPVEQRYDGWGAVVKQIESLKPSIYAPLTKAAVLRGADGGFLIKLDAFFSRIIAGSAENLSLLRAVLAEQEGVAPESIKLTVVEKAAGEVGNLADEVEQALNS